MKPQSENSPIKNSSPVKIGRDMYFSFKKFLFSMYVLKLGIMKLDIDF